MNRRRTPSRYANCKRRLIDGGAIRARFAFLVPVLIALTELSACATVRVEGDDGSVRVERHFGLLSVNLTSESGSVLAETTALGVARTWEGVTLGYYDGRMVALSRGDCRLVVWAENSEQVALLRRLLDGRGEVCVFSERETNDETDGNE